MADYSSAFLLLQASRTAARELGSAPVSQSLLDLQGELLQLQAQELELQLENRSLTTDVTRLRTSLAVQRKLTRALDAYLLVESEEDVRGPYCITCWDSREVLQLLVDAGEGMAYCRTCQKTVKADSPVSERRGLGQSGDCGKDAE